MRIITLAIAFLIGTNAQAQIIRAEPFYVSPEQPVTTLLLDAYPGAAVAYSLRKLDKDYTGSAIRVRRSSDNTEQDIGFVNNYLDTAAMKTFVGANNGFVVTWYNQADSAGVFGLKNATQTTATAQPRIINAGSLESRGNFTGLFFSDIDAGNDLLRTNINWNTQTWTAIAVASTSDSITSTKHIIDADPNPPRIAQLIRIDRLTPNTISHQLTTPTIDSSASIQINTNALLISEATSNSLTMYVNGQSNGSKTITGNNTAIVGLAIGGRFSTGVNLTPAKGLIQEIVLYLPTNSSNRSSIETAINSFYSIY